MSRFLPDDEQHLRRALQLALRGQGRVEPNPMVGCVLVRDQRVLGEGWHRRFGGPHAEVDALRCCGGQARGATAYVSLEPCCHTGKTPPCTAALLNAGIVRVVAPREDPDPRVGGGGFARLQQAGIRVDVGLLAEEAEALNAPFFKRVRTGRPWVILKWAQSLDGKIATRTGESKWISDERCRADAHRTRGRVDAIVVGVGTVIADDPLLTARGVAPRRMATRVVLDSNLRTPPTSQLVRTARDTPTWIFCAKQAPPRRAAALTRQGCVLQAVPRAKAGLRLATVLDRLGAAGMTNVLVEGGGTLLGTFVDARFADEVHVYLAPRLIGGRGAPAALQGLGAASMAEVLELPHATMARLGRGWVCRACLH